VAEASAKTFLLRKPVLRVLRVAISAPSVTSARLGSDLDPGFDFAGGQGAS